MYSYFNIEVGKRRKNNSIENLKAKAIRNSSVVPKALARARDLVWSMYCLKASHDRDSLCVKGQFNSSILIHENWLLTDTV